MRRLGLAHVGGEPALVLGYRADGSFRRYDAAQRAVCRPRPCQVLEDYNHFHTECGGSFSFVSNHAANAFALATFLFLRYRKQMKALPIIMFVWAFLTSYSRIYLGKHYPGDILCGALFGILVGWFVWWLTKIFEKKFTKCETKK